MSDNSESGPCVASGGILCSSLGEDAGSDTSLVDPLSNADVVKESFRVQAIKAMGVSSGASLQPHGTGMFVENVFPDDVLDSWNTKCPPSVEVRQYNKIVEVNGTTEVERMLETCHVQRNLSCSYFKALFFC